LACDRGCEIGEHAVCCFIVLSLGGNHHSR
jgi:hypothetical protein